MKLFASYEEKAKRALSDATSQHALAVGSLNAHDNTPPDPGDAAAIAVHRQRRAALVQNLEITAEVVAYWNAVVAKHESDAAEKALDAEGAALEREVSSVGVRDAHLALDLTSELREVLQRIEDRRSRSDEWNAAHGQRRYIPDAEFRVRQVPGRLSPEILSEPVAVYIDPDGGRHADNKQWDEQAGGYLVRKDWVLTEVRDVLQSGVQLPPTMPPRLAEVIKLPDLAVIPA